MSTLPKMSITRNNSSESSESSSTDNDMNYHHNNNCLTDLEDMDSQIQISCTPSRTNIKLPSKNSNSDNDATDIEDYNDSEYEDDVSQMYPELKISLNEFLKNGLEEQSLINNGIKEHIEIRPGDFLRAQSLNQMNNYLTDCEDYCTDSEYEYPIVKSVCVDLARTIEDQSKVCITDMTHTGADKEDDSDNNAEVSVLSDVSDLASALSCASAVDVYSLTEHELLSDTDGICQIEYSGSSNEDCYNEKLGKILRPVEVKFVHTNSQLNPATSFSSPCNNALLAVGAYTEEVLTDVEKLDDSEAEEYSIDCEDDNIKPIPRSVILATDDDDACHTDIEDILSEESTNFLDISEISYVIDACELPPVHREVIILKEDSNGDTITNVMPMHLGYTFGISNQKEEALTDSEEYSCTEDYERKCSISSLSFVPCSDCFESEFMMSSDILKPFTTRKFEIQSNMESITDVEELLMDGTNRRKKIKSRNLSKVKSRLGVRGDGSEGGVSDEEDVDLSETGLPSIENKEKNVKQYHSSNLLTANLVDPKNISDYMSDTSDKDHLEIKSKILIFHEHENTSSNIVHSFENDGSRNIINSMDNNKIYININNLQAQPCNKEHTAVEDLQYISGVVDNRTENICSSTDLNDMLNESYTVIYEKAGNRFNIEFEKLHIKGMPDSRDAHTDVEYVESDDKEGN